MKNKTESEEGGLLLYLDREEEDDNTSRKKKLCFQKQNKAIRIRIRRQTK